MDKNDIGRLLENRRGPETDALETLARLDLNPAVRRGKRLLSKMASGSGSTSETEEAKPSPGEPGNDLELGSYGPTLKTHSDGSVELRGIVSGRAYDEISELLNGWKGGTLRLRVHSPGGDAFAGVAIHNVMRMSGVDIQTECVGLAASAASYIFAAGGSRLMCPGSMLMIHDAWTLAFGNAGQLSQIAAELDAVSGSIAEVYEDVSGKTSAKEFRKMMKAETFLKAQQAVDFGLATGLYSMPKKKAMDPEKKDGGSPVEEAAGMGEEEEKSKSGSPGAVRVGGLWTSRGFPHDFGNRVPDAL